MRLVSIETCSDDFLSGFIELEDAYARFTIQEGCAAVIHARWPKGDFETLECFASQMGKFLPTFVFLRKPVNITTLDFGLLREQVEKIPALQVCR